MRLALFKGGNEKSSWGQCSDRRRTYETFTVRNVRNGVSYRDQSNGAYLELREKSLIVGRVFLKQLIQRNIRGIGATLLFSFNLISAKETEIQVPILMSSRVRVTELHPRTLGSFSSPLTTHRARVEALVLRIRTTNDRFEVRVRFIFRPTESRPVRLDVGPPLGRWPDFKFVRVTTIFFLLHVSSPLWREDGSLISSAITQWLESRRTRNHILLSHLRLRQPVGLCPLTHIPLSKILQPKIKVTLGLAVSQYVLETSPWLKNRH
jgi:hypothetical protein